MFSLCKSSFLSVFSRSPASLSSTASSAPRFFSSLSRLTGSDLESALQSVPTWTRVGNRDVIRRSFQFRDFNHAFAFMTRCALLAEKLNHHPSWHNVYNQVEIELETHDVGGLSLKDFHMAKEIDNFYN